MFIASGEDLQPLFLLSDEPSGTSGEKRLGVCPTVRVTDEAAMGAATPYTVGIFGAWGQGKHLAFRNAENAPQATFVL